MTMTAFEAIMSKRYISLYTHFIGEVEKSLKECREEDHKGGIIICLEQLIYLETEKTKWLDNLTKVINKHLTRGKRK